MGDAWLLPYRSGQLVGEVSLLRHRHDLGQLNLRQKPVTILEVLDQGGMETAASHLQALDLDLTVMQALQRLGR